MSNFYREYTPRHHYSWGPFNLLCMIMLAVLVVVLLFSLVSAMMFVSDLAEEYPTRFRFLLKCCILINLVVHGLICVIDRVSWAASLLSFAANVCYLRVFLRTFPWIDSLTSAKVIVTGLIVLLESAFWYLQCIQLMHDDDIQVQYTAAFMCFLWAVPLLLLASCAVEEERLPGMQGGSSHNSGSSRGRNMEGGGLGGLSAAPAGKKKTVFNRLIGVFKN